MRQIRRITKKDIQDFGAFFLLVIFVFALILYLASVAWGEAEVSLLTNHARSVEIKYTFDRIEPFVLSQINNEGPWYAWGTGVDYELLRGPKASLDIGLVWLAETNKMNGTRFNSHFELQHKLTDRLSLSLSHISHGSKFGIEKNKSNQGWNWVGVTWKW